MTEEHTVCKITQSVFFESKTNWYPLNKKKDALVLVMEKCTTQYPKISKKWGNTEQNENKVGRCVPKKGKN